MKDILSTITTYREERGWTEYQLAERSGLPQSTISSWYRKNMVPTVASLEKICTAVNGKIKYTNFGHEKYTTLRH